MAAIVSRYRLFDEWFEFFALERPDDGEHFLVLADFETYARAQDEVDALYRNGEEWSRRAMLNSLSMGPFSSDRSIRDSADNIWHVKPVL